MKKKEKTAFIEMTMEDLKLSLVEADSKLNELRLSRDSSQNRNTRAARNLRKKKAVILTMLREKEMQHETKP